MKHLVTPLVGALVLIPCAVLAAAAAIFLFPFITGGESSILGSYSSPDTKYKALVYVRAGGGGLAPYCTQSVAVVSAAHSDSIPSERYTVFSAGCETLPDQAVEWVGERQLRIKAARRLDAQYKTSDASHAIKIEYLGQ